MKVYQQPTAIVTLTTETVMGNIIEASAEQGPPVYEDPIDDPIPGGNLVNHSRLWDEDE